ncbi:hypothetical protein G6F22_020547 [Rhizopus arrhizus]|nr:hypothetical protein G6F22_020547 [Rhizopus arrhizus]
MRQIQGQDFVLVVVHFQLHGAPRLAQFRGHRPRRLTCQLRIDQACDLHGQRGPARHDAPVGGPLPTRARQRDRIHPGVPVEPAVLIGQQGIQIAGRHLVRLDRITPDAIAAGVVAQRRAVGGDDNRRPAGVDGGKRIQAVQHE